MLDYEIRPGTPDDEGALLALFDEAVAWMVARGQTGQWGDRPFSQRAETGARAGGRPAFLGGRKGRGGVAEFGRASGAVHRAPQRGAPRRAHRRRPPAPRR